MVPLLTQYLTWQIKNFDIASTAGHAIDNDDMAVHMTKRP